MAIAASLGKRGARAAMNAGRPVSSINAVYDDELWTILRHYGLLDPLDRGDLRCYLTGIPLTRDNIGGLIGASDGPHLISDHGLDRTSKQEEGLTIPG